MTIVEKILAQHSTKKKLKGGEFVFARVDLAFANDVTAPLAIKQLQKLKVKRIVSQNNIALIPDHFTPNKDIKSAEQCKLLRDFADKYKIRNYFEVGEAGIEHVLLPEKGLVKPGDLIVGADSHTCTLGALGALATGMGSTDIAFAWLTGKCWFRVPETMRLNYEGKLGKWLTGKDIILYTIKHIGVDGANYKAMEFGGKVISRLNIEDRFTICNMAIEAGAKTGIIAPDEKTIAYLEGKIDDKLLGRIKAKINSLKTDNEKDYEQIITLNVNDWEPAVACPHLPSKVKGVSSIKGIKIDQAFIGSCTNGRITDLRLAAKILQGKKVAKGVRLIITPATPKIYLQALEQGLIEIFLKAGALISPPTCGPCLGGHMGVLAKGEVCIATTNRNFKGRMGSPNSYLYLANPAVVAASAIKGYIAHPEEVL